MSKKCNTIVTPKRYESYNKLSEYLNSKGAPSNIWSDLEKIYEGNGIFLRQRDKIEQLQSQLKNGLIREKHLKLHLDALVDQLKEAIEVIDEIADLCRGYADQDFIRNKARQFLEKHGGNLAGEDGN